MIMRDMACPDADKPLGVDAGVNFGHSSNSSFIGAIAERLK